MSAQRTRNTSTGFRLDPSLLGRLDRVAARLRSYVLVEGVAWVLGFLLVACGLQLMLDYGTHGLQWSMRLVLSLLIVGGTLRVAWRRLIAPLRVPVTTAAVANLIERKNPQLASGLISAVRFASGEVGDVRTNAPALMARVVNRIGAATERINFGAVLSDRRAKRSGAVIAGVVLICLIGSITIPGVLGIWFTRNVLLRDVAWPRRTHLVVDLPDGEIVAARGDDVIIEATAQGVQPRSVELFFETASGKAGRDMMRTVGSAGAYRYQYTFKNAQEDFTFHLRGGDDRTIDFRARLLERPHLIETELRVEPPAYTGAPAIILGDGQRAAQVLFGSRVTITARANKPIARASLMADSDVVAAVETDGSRLSVTVVPEQSNTYHFALVDEAGLENRQPLRFAVRVARDEAPHVRLKIPDVGEMITPQAVLPLDIELSESIGLAQAEILFKSSREGALEGSLEVPGFERAIKTLSSSLSWPAAEANVAPGESLALWARAADYDDVSGPNVAESAEVSLRVVTTDELMAELSRREQEHRADFERLIDAQEQLRSSLLSAFGRFNAPDAPKDELAATLVPLERRQRNIAGSVNALRQQFEHILAELRVNQLNTREAEKRLGTGIVEPLTVLARRDLVLAADLIRRWSRDGTPESASLIDPQQADVLLHMREVLARMIQYEGYQEAVNMLRDILRLENELNEETKRKIEEQAGDLFDK